MPEDTGDPAAPRPWQRHLVALLAVTALVHSIVLVMWLAPSSAVRDAVGAQRLGWYVNPYFQQSWDQLDPNAQFVDESFRVRAHVRDDETGKDRVTPWVDLVSEQGSTGDLDPARAGAIPRSLATNLNGAMFGMNAAQRKLVQRNYISTPLDVLRDRLRAAGDDAAAETYLKYDAMATRFASLYAKARHGGTILEVQYLVGRRTVPPFAARHDTKLDEADFRWFAFGYRLAYRGSYDQQRAFDPYVER